MWTTPACRASTSDVGAWQQDGITSKRKIARVPTGLSMIHSFDVLVLGGGAAGLMCAIEAGKRGRRVAVLERADQIGKKILISGGGRCNFTHLH